MLELNDALRKAEIDPEAVIVLRHSPPERALRRVLPWLAESSPALFEAYQNHQEGDLVGALGRASYAASFLGQPNSTALFVGIYRVSGQREIALDEYWAMSEYRELRELGMRGPPDGATTTTLFDLAPTDLLSPWKGKLVVAWPAPAVRWWRWAAKNRIDVVAIHADSILAGPMPPWQELVLTWAQLEKLPPPWKARLGEWRGVYVILDTSDGKSYVGSAYGGENILGRWRAYARSGHGDNARLKDRDPRNFQFAILERLSPDLPADEVIRVEKSWKDRLGTREVGLNEN